MFPPTPEPPGKASGLCCIRAPSLVLLIADVSALVHICIGGERGPRHLWVSCQSLEIPSPRQGGAGESPSWELRAASGATEDDC